ncbi:hypothetical protein PFLG_03165, partial [Plasmodium falciparum RAJ116]
FIQDKIKKHTDELSIENILQEVNNIYIKYDTSINEISKYNNLIINTDLQIVQQKLLEIKQKKNDITHKVQLINHIYKNIHDEILNKKNNEITKIIINNIKDHKKDLQDLFTIYTTNQTI